ncbi:MAG: hypothetical protein Q8916_05325, partial [Bacteroidota bacterium]|nr:hypothetical protein [Bacteroidota bacterium]
MKSIFYFALLLTLILSSCASHPTQTNRINIQYTNGQSQDAILLATRPKALLVAPVNIGESRDTLLASATSIPMDSVFRVSFSRKPVLTDAIPGALWGLPLGLVAGYFVFAAIAPPFGGLFFATYWVATPIIGSLVGGAIGYATGAQSREFDPHDFRDY